MTTHIIQDGVVVNTIIATVSEAQSAFPDAICIEATEGGIGWLWDGETLTPPPPGPLAERQAAAWERIKQERDRRKYLGVKVGAHWFHSDDPSRIQQLGLARKADRLEASGGSMDTPFSGPGPGGTLAWKTIGGSFVPMTPALAQQISGAIEALDLGVFAAAEVHRVAMEASENPESYDCTTGWPASIEDTP